MDQEVLHTLKVHPVRRPHEIWAVALCDVTCWHALSPQQSLTFEWLPHVLITTPISSATGAVDNFNNLLCGKTPGSVQLSHNKRCLPSGNRSPCLSFVHFVPGHHGNKCWRQIIRKHTPHTPLAWGRKFPPTPHPLSSATSDPALVTFCLAIALLTLQCDSSVTLWLKLYHPRILSGQRWIKDSQEM